MGDRVIAPQHGLELIACLRIHRINMGHCRVVTLSGSHIVLVFERSDTDLRIQVDLPLCTWHHFVQALMRVVMGLLAELSLAGGIARKVRSTSEGVTKSVRLFKLNLMALVVGTRTWRGAIGLQVSRLPCTIE